MRKTEKNIHIQALFGSAVIIAVIFILAFGAVFVEQERNHANNCDTIRENSEYTVDDLGEADCMNLDYLNTL